MPAFVVQVVWRHFLAEAIPQQVGSGKIVSACRSRPSAGGLPKRPSVHVFNGRVLISFIKDFLRPLFHRVLLGHAVRQIRSKQSNELTLDDARLLIRGWSNPAWSITPELAVSLWKHALESNGPILECGSGISSILLGLALERSGREVFCLEHDSIWKGKIETTARRFQLKNVTVIYSALIDYGEFVWFERSPTLLAQKYSFIFCDGPPGATKGGRYGVLPVLLQALEYPCLILLDDASRPEEQKTLNRWSENYGVRYEIVDCPKPYAIAVKDR